MTIPRTAGGRIWFSQDATLTFLLNPGPALVEPSVTNESDPNYNIYWDFCEFTFNAAELFINISYVDFVSLPIGLQLENTAGTITTVEGLPSNGLDTVCAGLVAQTAADGADWADLIIKTSSGANLRALSPNSGITMNNSLFSTYWDSYITQVWAQYSNGVNLTIDTQASWGSSTGTVTDDDILSFGSDVGTFTAPTSADVFSCSSGPFATTTSQMGAIGARLAAAFNRSTLLTNALQPDNEVVAQYYTDPVTNHYARLMHATYLDGKGYAFPYDDVAPANGADQSGSLFDANPRLLTVTVGGPSAAARAVRLRDMATRTAQRPAGRRAGAMHQRGRRDLVGWASAEDEKRMLAAAADKSNGFDDDEEDSADADLEKGLGRGEHAFPSAKGGLSLLSSSSKDARGYAVHEPRSSSSSLMGRSLTSLVPRRWAEAANALLARIEASPAYANVTRPMVSVVVRLVSLVLSLSVQALISRVTMAIFLVLFYLFVPFVSRGQSGMGAAGAETPGGFAVVNMVNATLASAGQQTL